MEHRTVRIVCISDTHNQTPKLPPGDILIHAGDITNQGTYSELQKSIMWLEKADFLIKIVIAGNHDITLDKSFYQQYGQYFHSQGLEDPQECLNLLRNSKTIHYLDHESAILHLPMPDGQKIRLKVFGSPYSPSRGLWAFGYAAEDARNLWDQIPLDADLVVTHTPAKYHCDAASNRVAAGCEELREALWRVRPRLALCGHIHEGRGVEVVQWDLFSPNIKFKEQHSLVLPDNTGASKKQFRVDLTEKSGKPLQNDGSCGDMVPTSRRLSQRGVEVDGSNELQTIPSLTSVHQKRNEPEQPFPNYHKAQRPISTQTKSYSNIRQSTVGQGLGAADARSDIVALSGRMNRKETCFVNAAIMGSNYPHRGGKKFNKPIVVDIDLPLEPGTDDWVVQDIIALEGQGGST